jgi:hypothetical protein
MAKFQINKKAALIATAIGTLIVSNVATYKTSYSNGYKTSITQSRVGYMPIPKTSGELIVSKVNGKPHYYFEAYPDVPAYNSRKAWDSDDNRKYLEWSIKNESVNANDQEQRINVASVACVAQTTTNFWDCNWRELGNTYNHHWRVEVNPSTGRWQSS